MFLAFGKWIFDVSVDFEMLTVGTFPYVFFDDLAVNSVIIKVLVFFLDNVADMLLVL